MRLQISKFLTVCLLTLIVLSPELVVVSVAWEQHMQLVEIQHLSCKVEQIQTGVFRILGSQNTDLLTLEQECQNFTQDTNNIKIFDTNFLHILLTYTQLYKIVDLLKWFFLLFPIVLGIFFFLYDRYLVYRAGIFQQQVEMLERLWQESIEK
ncbi:MULTISPECIES: hypothetical protein [Fischerella]|uniref:Uncharacterized protein n=1 Tax=Fischerella muscicola CCMEE 5323 TaxID=2019572 RepID=A0A2N6K0E7_FISMU|nr:MULTISPECIES: hypothetical protein [Fischerella]MBD2433186.1 hypothetical protein [Fischerella sp. FACHB-380]PLZ87525.1 hypothetical protein CEN44_17295 [Fischerella muscicola CCMEE 5323]